MLSAEFEESFNNNNDSSKINVLPTPTEVENLFDNDLSDNNDTLNGIGSSGLINLMS